MVKTQVWKQEFKGLPDSGSDISLLCKMPCPEGTKWRIVCVERDRDGEFVGYEVLYWSKEFKDDERDYRHHLGTRRITPKDLRRLYS